MGVDLLTYARHTYSLVDEGLGDSPRSVPGALSIKAEVAEQEYTIDLLQVEGD